MVTICWVGKARGEEMLVKGAVQLVWQNESLRPSPQIERMAHNLLCISKCIGSRV